MVITESKDLCMKGGSHYIPKDNPSKPLEEDANFIDMCAQVIGVTDGVGSWSRKGIDSGEYARQLLENVADIVYGCPPKFNTKLTDILIQAFKKTSAKGSSTVCLLTLAGNKLHTANLGDSRFLVIRGGRILYKSKIMQHRFNRPYQIRSSSGDGPLVAEEVEIEVERGDVVIVGTDGLFDNVFDGEIEDRVGFCMESGVGPEDMAVLLAMVAQRNMVMRENMSPFEVAASVAGVVHCGGKYDDVTVVAAYIS